MRYARRLLELGGDPELLFFGIVFELKQVRLAANLAVLDVALTTSGGFVDVGHVPLAAAGALEAGFHEGDCSEVSGRICGGAAHGQKQIPRFGSG